MPEWLNNSGFIVYQLWKGTAQHIVLKAITWQQQYAPCQILFKKP